MTITEFKDQCAAKAKEKGLEIKDLLVTFSIWNNDEPEIQCIFCFEEKDQLSFKGKTAELAFMELDLKLKKLEKIASEELSI